ncbi:DUF433 domain-containing protein [Arenibacter sp. GZD96]|uniref:DUF433 domain-containing protein n=1 Tax=Aurantibrevibacter litoralis TaxID=3106030 RepID=UPI002AFE0EA6|nr:DUF433 domain-containing protein [Arenibacter sp. GZD-96]MEA1785611.1 DUF433 domain-containing protein [Arenibacter sp. GZD-96]
MDLKSALGKYVSVSPEVLGGTPVFKGTRVPIKILFDYLQGGDNIQEFLENYPTVKKNFAQKVLELLSTYLTEIETNNGTAA